MGEEEGGVGGGNWKRLALVFEQEERRPKARPDNQSLAVHFQKLLCGEHTIHIHLFYPKVHYKKL